MYFNDVILDYGFEPETGIWRHHHAVPGARLQLEDISYRSGEMEYRSRHLTEPESVFDDYLNEARQIAARLGTTDDPHRSVSKQSITLPAHLERLRWFTLPGEGEGEGS